MAMRTPRRGDLVLALVTAAALTGGLSACTSAAPAPSPTTSSPTSTPAETQTPAAPTPTAPVLVPKGTAKDNLPLFQATVDAVWAGPDSVVGRAYIDALVSVGFDKAAMQLTSDTSTVGNPAESIQFSVLWGTQCLVGQVGPATGTAVTVVVPALSEGGCLIGATRPIDW